MGPLMRDRVHRKGRSRMAALPRGRALCQASPPTAPTGRARGAGSWSEQPAWALPVAPWSASMGDPSSTGTSTSVERVRFGEVDGADVDSYVLRHAGITARVITYGAILTELHVPDRHGASADVVLGFDRLAGYLAEHPYFGATVGRVANRIARGRFTLDGVEYRLACNNGRHHLHGGVRGFDRRIWSAVSSVTADGPSVTFRYTSP